MMSRSDWAPENSPGGAGWVFLAFLTLGVPGNVHAQFLRLCNLGDYKRVAVS